MDVRGVVGARRSIWEGEMRDDEVSKRGKFTSFRSFALLCDRNLRV
jgi:hypothetical protein